MNLTSGSLKNNLENLVKTYNRKEYINTDPIATVHGISGSRNREFAAFIVSIFSFGTVKQIQKTANRFFGIVPANIFEYLAESPMNANFRTGSVQHRFIKGSDIQSILKTLQIVIKEHGSIESLFMRSFRTSSTMKGAIIGFSEEMRRLYRARNRTYSERILRFIFPSPASGCAAKRMNLFLRWMVRKDEIDLGLWKDIVTCQLILPLDTHTARISKQLGFTRRETPGWAMAQEITERLKEFDPDDPVKYDFALTRLGMLKQTPQ